MPRIAVADDDPDLRGALAEGLRVEGFDVEELADGADLLAALAGGGFAAVVTDLWMPALGGDEVIRRCRAAGDAVPFVVITAAPPRFTDQLATLDRVIVLRKPFALGELVRAVARATG